MNKEQFTPGPWLAIPNGYNPDYDLILVTLDKEKHAAKAEEYTGGNITFNYVPVSQAAAAPDMYEALKDLLKLHRNAIEDGSPEYGIISRANAVVSKINPDYGKD